MRKFTNPGIKKFIVEVHTVKAQQLRDKASRNDAESSQFVTKAETLELIAKRISAAG